VGGFGHLFFFGQGGFLDHEDTVANITLFAKEVLLRLRELNPEPQKPSRQISGSVRFIRPLPWSKTRSCGASGQIEQLGGQLIELGKDCSRRDA
jgi:hypothetical protein